MPKKNVQKKEVKKPELSIITVNWNGLEYLKKCVDSIEKFTKDYELIIVDNNSEDGSVEYLNTLKKKHKVIFLKENTGWVGGINEGLKHCEGEYICFMNNDIEVTQDWYPKMKCHFDSPTTYKVGMVGCTCNFTMGLQQASLNDQIEGNHHHVKYLIGWLMLIPRKVLQEVAQQDYDKELEPINGLAGLDPIFGIGSSDDLDLSLRIRKAGYELFIARDVFVYHHGSKSFEKMFGVGIKTVGTEAQKKYFEDVEAKQKFLKEKWGEEEVADMLKIDMPKPKFLGTLGIPHLDFIPHRFHTDLIALQGLERIKISHIYGSQVHKARNDIAKTMSGDYLIFIDSDMTFGPDTITKLVEAAKRDDVDIVSAACFRKVPKYEPCFFHKIPDETIKYYQPVEWDEENLFEVDGVGSACVLIKRKVLEDVPFPWYEYTTSLSEDLNFCRKAKEKGFRIWVDPTIKIGHLTMMPVDQRVYKAFNAQKIKEYQEEKAKLNGRCPLLEKFKSNNQFYG